DARLGEAVEHRAHARVLRVLVGVGNQCHARDHTVRARRTQERRMSDEQSLPATATGSAPAGERLAGRRIVVVGGGSQGAGDPDAPPGNGQAMSILAAREGASVAVVDVRPEAAAETVGLVEEAGGSATPVIADVAEPDQCDRLVDE